jgi:molybdate transport system substrate-binding protein
LPVWAGEVIRVGVAISLKDAMSQIAQAYQDKTHENVELTFGSSGQIQAQIINGARIDAFISAGTRQVDDLASRQMILSGSQRVVAGNELVLIVPADAKAAPANFAGLVDASVKRIAIGEPATVPAGDYAMQVLKHLQLADKLKDRLVYGANVRQVLSYVERGEVSAGIVYRTDAMESGQRVKIVAAAHAGAHEPIVYPAVVIGASKHAASATRFLDYLCSESARKILRDNGFTAPEPSSTQASE